MDRVIDPRRLRILRAVADHRTVTAAAAALYLTPSAVSQQLNALEQETGHALLIRSGKGVRLTAAGEILLAHTHTVLAQLERAEAELAAYAGGAAGEVTVAAFATGIAEVVAPAIVHLAAYHPDIRVRVRDAEGDESLPLVLDGEADLAVAVEYRGRPARTTADCPGCRCTPSRSTPYCMRDIPSARVNASSWPSSPTATGSAPIPATPVTTWCCSPANSPDSSPASCTPRTTSAPWSPSRERRPEWHWCRARRCAGWSSRTLSYGPWRAPPRPAGSSPPCDGARSPTR